MSFNARLTYWYTLLGLAVPNIALCITEPMSLLQAATNIILPFGVMWGLISLSRKIGVSVWAMFPLIFIAAFQIVLLMLYGRGVIAVDMYLNVVTTNPSEAGELLVGLVPALLLVGVLYLPPLAGATLALVKRQKLSAQMMRNCRRLSRLTISLGAILFILCLVSSTPYRPLRQLYPLNAFYNLCLAVGRTDSQHGYPESAQHFAFNSVSTDSIPSLTVIVVGETSRAENWQLFGYTRPTNPRLTAETGLTPFPRALSQSNTTHKSVPLMLSHLGAEQFGDSIYLVKSIISAFKEAGARTAFISNQARNGAMIDAFGEEADTVVFLSDRVDSGRLDSRLLVPVGAFIHSCTRRDNALLVIHTYGSHYCYYDRYPDDHSFFTPDRPLQAEASCRPSLINAYDNTIRYTDEFLASLMEMIKDSGLNASLIYTSDHGEDIYDDSRNLFLHASPVPSFHQLRVPFLIWMSPAYSTAHPDRVLIARANSRRPVATSSSVFHTGMMLGGISSPRLDSALSVVSNCYTPPAYTYLDDHNEAVTPAQAVFDMADILKIDSIYGISSKHAPPWHTFLRLQSQTY